MKTQFHYKNHRGEVELRTIEPISLDYVCTPHPEYGYGPGWFLHGLDYTERDGKPRNGEARSFALSNIQMLDFRIPMAAHGAAPSFRIFLDGLDAPLSPLYLQQVGRAVRPGHEPKGAFEQSVEDFIDGKDRPRGGFKLTEDTSAGSTDNSVQITGRLRNAVKGPYFPGTPDRLSGESYGHISFPDGTPIHTSEVKEDLGDGLFRTKSGSIYKVESWLPGHEPK